MDAPPSLLRTLRALWEENDPATFPRFFLSGPEDSVLAWGAARSLRTPCDQALGPSIESALEMAGDQEVFGGARFSPSSEVDPGWAPFGGSFFFVPREIRRAGNAAEASPASEKIPAVLEDLDAAAYREALSQALTQIAHGELAKVVVARRYAGRIQGTDAWSSIPDMLSALLHASGHGRVFLFSPAPFVAWVGRTPEQLVHLASGVLKTEAVAGTRQLAHKNRAFQPSGEVQEKEELEHALVVSHLTSVLSSHDLSPEVGARTTRNAGALMHWVTPIRAHAPHIHLGALIASLHPTPAMNGVPAEASRAFLHRHETFDRGWYAGFLGSLGRTSADLVVGIRGARIDATGCMLYAGGGLVRGSNAEDEARETEAKARAIAAGFGWEVA